MSATLQAKFSGLLTEANQLLTDGKLAEAKAKREEAETVKAQLDEWRAIATLSDAAGTMDPQRPPLPGTNNGTSNGTEKNGAGSTQVVQVIEGRQEPEESPVIKAAYINRLGSSEEEITAILKAMHGSDFKGKFWTQKAAFNKYLRQGEVGLTGDDRALLRQIIMTPGAVKTALEQGVEGADTLKTTLVEAADSLGGYTVPVDIQSRIITRMAGTTIVRQRARKITTSRDRVEMPRMMDNGGDTTDRYTSPVRVRWVDETPASLEAQNITFGMVGIPVHTAMVEAFLSRNLLEDSAFNLEDYLTEQFGEASAIDEDDQFLFGNGVGKPLGILPNHQNTLGIPEAVSGLTTDPFFKWDNLIAVPYAIPRQYRQNSVWMSNRHTVLKARTLKDDNGNYLWTPYMYQGGETGEPAKLLGTEFVEQEGFSDVANGAYPILYGDLSAYQIVDRVGMTVERYVDSFTARQNLVCFVMRRRVGGQLLEPWRLVAVKVAAS